MMEPIAFTEFKTRLYSAFTAEEFSVFFDRPHVVVYLNEAALRSTDVLRLPPFAPRCPVIGLVDAPLRGNDVIPHLVDVVAVGGDELDALTTAIEHSPIAAMTLVQLTRANEQLGVREGLFAESLAYSTLQHGAEFERWLAGCNAKPPRTFEDEAVLMQRTGDELHLTLNRPQKRNAYSNELREALCAALQLALGDETLMRIVLDGAGACFSAGGDLDEFGSARDAGIAHASRMTRNAGQLLHLLKDKVVVRVHGACIGAGIELPAFAARIEAKPDAFFQLPEVGMGLIPGAGGTMSILARIGRHRMNHLALTGMRLDASTALEWGLIDAIVD